MQNTLIRVVSGTYFNTMTIQEVREQIQEDLLSIVEGYGLEQTMDQTDYENLMTSLCDAVVQNINKLEDK